MINSLRYKVKGVVPALLSPGHLLFLKVIPTGLLLPFLIFLLTACGSSHIDEKYAATLAQNTFALSEPVVAEKLIGGLSGAQLFVVSAHGEKYVVRFFAREKPGKWAREIANLKVASQGGYGPHIYFADATQGVVIMEFLPAQKISPKQRETEQLYVELARVLQEMHRGPSFPTNLDVFERINKDLAKVKAAAKTGVPLDKLQKILGEIQQACAFQAETAPSHNDLNPGDLIFLGQEIKIVDFETAAQADPYFDLSTVAIFYCMMETVWERVLFNTYLDRPPTPREEARFYLMKQVARINYAVIFLLMTTPEKLAQYQDLPDVHYRDFFQLLSEGKVDLATADGQLKFGKGLVDWVIANAESPAYRAAIDLLTENSEERKGAEMGSARLFKFVDEDSRERRFLAY